MLKLLIPMLLAAVPAFAHDQYHLCTTGGDPMGNILCFYVPPMGF